MKHRGGARAAAAFVAAMAFAGNALARDIHVNIDSAAAMRVSAPVEGVAIGNPAIAGVSMQNDRMLFVTGRSYGSTSLTLVGANGRVIYNGRIVVTPNEDGTVTLMHGSATERLACSPTCRPSPDIGDDPQIYSTATGQISTHSGAAQASGDRD